MLINECSTHADEPTEDYSRGQMCVSVTRLCCQQGENVQAQSSISWSPDHNCTHSTATSSTGQLQPQTGENVLIAALILLESHERREEQLKQPRRASVSAASVTDWLQDAGSRAPQPPGSFSAPHLIIKKKKKKKSKKLANNSGSKSASWPRNAP